MYTSPYHRHIRLFLRKSTRNLTGARNSDVTKCSGLNLNDWEKYFHRHRDDGVRKYARKTLRKNYRLELKFWSKNGNSLREMLSLIAKIALM